MSNIFPTHNGDMPTRQTDGPSEIHHHTDALYNLSAYILTLIHSNPNMPIDKRRKMIIEKISEALKEMGEPTDQAERLYGLAVFAAYSQRVTR